MWPSKLHEHWAKRTNAVQRQQMQSIHLTEKQLLEERNKKNCFFHFLKMNKNVFVLCLFNEKKVIPSLVHSQKLFNENIIFEVSSFRAEKNRKENRKLYYRCSFRLFFLSFVSSATKRKREKWQRKKTSLGPPPMFPTMKRKR